MKGKVGELEQQLQNQARQSLSSNQRDTARKLRGKTAGTIRDQMIKEKIEYLEGRDVQRRGVLEADRVGWVQPLEARCARKIGSGVRVRRSKTQQGQGMNRAVNQARDLGSVLLERTDYVLLHVERDLAGDALSTL